MEAYSNPEKVISDAHGYFNSATELFHSNEFLQAYRMYDYALRTFRKLNMKDETNVELMNEKEKVKWEVKCHQMMAEAALSGNFADAFAILKAATYCLELDPSNTSALISRINAFLLPGVWQSRIRALGDIAALKELDAAHPYLLKFAKMKLPSLESEASFGQVPSKVAASNDPEVLAAMEGQRNIRQNMINAFSSNIHRVTEEMKKEYEMNDSKLASSTLKTKTKALTNEKNDIKKIPNSPDHTSAASNKVKVLTGAKANRKDADQPGCCARLMSYIYCCSKISRKDSRVSSNSKQAKYD